MAQTTWVRIDDTEQRRRRIAAAVDRLRARRSAAEGGPVDAAPSDYGEIWMRSRDAGATVWLWTVADGDAVIVADLQLDGNGSRNGADLWPLIEELAEQQRWSGLLRFSEYRGDAFAAELADASGAACTGTKMQVDVARVALPEQVALRAMTDRDFAEYTTKLSTSFAEELYESGSVGSRVEALASSEQMLSGLLPAGVNTPRQHLWTVHDSDARVGILWLEFRDDRAFIYDIEMLPAVRGRGYGTQTLRLAAEQARAVGLPTVALNVFGHNQRAQHLYAKEGYEVTETVWAVRLTPDA